MLVGEWGFRSWKAPRGRFVLSIGYSFRSDPQPTIPLPMIPDWQLPPGVDRGLWDYLHSGDVVRGYDGQMAASPLARADVAFCERAFPTPGRLVDLGCGTGRLCVHFAAKGCGCVGVDLSDEMLAKARENA